MNSARQEAIVNGSKFYASGTDCPRAHGGMRRTSSGACPMCARDAMRRNYEDAGYRALARERYKRWREKVKDNSEFKEKARANSRRYRAENPYACNFHYAKRNKSRKLSTPAWLTKQQREEMQGFYEYAALKTRATGEVHAVDHIVPLQGKTVCGLNVPWNLQVLTAKANRVKSDHMPSELQQVCRIAIGYRK